MLGVLRRSTLPGVGIAFIYGLRDPRTRAIRYIGKARNPRHRLGQHRRDRPRDRKRNHREAWIDSLAADGISPEIVILEVCDGSSWKAAECRWIAAAKAAGWDLVNGTAGGDAGPLVPRRGFTLHRVHHALIMLAGCERAVRQYGAAADADRIAGYRRSIKEMMRAQPRKVHHQRARALLG